jgi:DNA-binding winged helix-turn-helix (wHTH) protein
VPVGCDLRRLGWSLIDRGCDLPPDCAPPLLAMPSRQVVADWVMLIGANPVRRRRVLAVGVNDALERARLLRLGFGDAIGGAPVLEELELRALRIDEAMRALPRKRELGPLLLDLLMRDGFVGGRQLGLHPREFLLLWRLSDDPGRAVAAHELRSDVWRLAFRPETNSLAVHISRLRTKLRTAGLDGLIETCPDGAYCLARAMLHPSSASTAEMQGNLGLDATRRLGKEAGEQQSGIEDQCGTN